MTAVAKSAAQLNSAKILEVQVHIVSVCRHVKVSFPECSAFRDRLLEAFMATREQLAIVLDSARGGLPMTSTGYHDLFYAFHQE